MLIVDIGISLQNQILVQIYFMFNCETSTLIHLYLEDNLR